MNDAPVSGQYEIGERVHVLYNGSIHIGEIIDVTKWKKIHYNNTELMYNVSIGSETAWVQAANIYKDDTMRGMVDILVRI